ncbi:MAG: hypothetical protein ACRDQZ_22525 [Mycobacteriales bacterium]
MNVQLGLAATQSGENAECDQLPVAWGRGRGGHRCRRKPMPLPDALARGDAFPKDVPTLNLKDHTPLAYDFPQKFEVE